MTKRRIVIVLFALIGAVFGAAVGAFVAPTAKRYTVSADVAMLPAPDLTTVEASDFWDVLTRGQVSRTAAVIYSDYRWIPSAAQAAGVPQSELTLYAAALPETTLLTVTVTANSGAAAETAINDILINAAQEVASVTAPYTARVLWPAQNSASPVAVPGRTQVAAAGAVAGLLGGGGIGWFVARRRFGQPAGDDHPGGAARLDGAGQLRDGRAGDDVVEDHPRHRA